MKNPSNYGKITSKITNKITSKNSMDLCMCLKM